MKLVRKIGSVALAALLILANHANAQSLQQYNIQPGSITVSGISSGGAMAAQFHFSHSSIVKGAGIFAGLPYCCATAHTTNTCMNYPGNVNLNALISKANELSQTDKIDTVSNIAGHRVYIWQGSRDTTVRPGSGPNVQNVYTNFGANVRTQFTYAAEHGFPTDSYGATCGSSSAGTQYFNNCGYKGAFEALNWLYGETLTRPSGGEGDVHNLLQFDQSEFFQFSPSLSSMDTVGFVYVPSACAAGAQCRFHIAFHGCAQSRGNIGNGFAVNSGYLDVAELNNMVILFPQIVMTAANVASCWDWYGYLNTYYPTQEANQVLATWRMMTRATG